MPIRAIRHRLRLIRYYSANRPRSRWSRALDIALGGALVAALPTTWVMDRAHVGWSTPGTHAGQLYREPDGRVWAWLTPPAVPPDDLRGDAEFHGAFQIDTRTEDHGWPFISSHSSAEGSINVELFRARRSLRASDLPDDMPERAAIEAALRDAGQGLVSAAVWAPDAAETHRVTGWLANGIAWSVILMATAWVTVGALRLAAVVASVGRHARRSRRRPADPLRCAHCGYDLRASTYSERCPECGTLLD